MGPLARAALGTPMIASACLAISASGCDESPPPFRPMVPSAATSAAPFAEASSAEAPVAFAKGPLPIPADRVTIWNPGLMSVGGIPRRTAVCTTVRPSGGDDTALIQSAIDACPDHGVVQLAAGDFHIDSGPIKITSDPNASDPQVRRGRSNVTVRGAGSGAEPGKGNTRLLLPTTGNTGPAFLIGTSAAGAAYYTQATPLVADAPRGSTSIQVAQDPGFAVGELVTIDETVDPQVSWYSARGGDGGMFSMPHRPIGQVVEIKAIQGTTVSLSAPLHFDYKTGQSAQVLRFWQGYGLPLTSPVHDSGVEDLYIAGGAGGSGHVALMRCKYCWVKNVESDAFVGSAIDMQGTFRAELRDSYIHSTRDPNPGGGGYAISIGWHGADDLVENTIAWNVNKVDVARSSGGGNVFGYNYFQDGWGAGYPTLPEVGMNASHYPTPHMELFEGNESWNAESDIVFGNSVYLTFFRNHMTGRRISASPLSLSDTFRHAAGTGLYSKWFNFLGNVLGTEGDPLAPQSSAVYEKTPVNMCESSVYAIWMLGWGDAKGNCGVIQPGQQETAATVLRHGNFDYVTHKVVWEPSIATHALPASAYLRSKPAFFGDDPWPWVTPENPTRPLATLPARARFERLHAK